MELGNIKDLINAVVTKAGFRLYGVKLKTEGEERILEVVIDNYAKGVSLDDIVKVSEALSSVLDEDTSLGDNYTLDVTSSGAEKVIPLDEVSHYLTLYLKVSFHEHYKGNASLTGYLLENSPNTLIIEVNNKGRISKISIPKSNIKQINRAIKF